MKFSVMITTALAAFVSAAPAAAPVEETQVEARNFNIDITGLNGLKGFNNVDLNYLLRLNSLDLNLFNQLGQVHGLNLNVFQHAFQVQAFDIQALLQFQQISTLLAFQKQGLFNGLALNNLNLGVLDFGLIGGLGGVNLGQFIGQDIIPQIAQIARQPTTHVLITKE